MKSPTGPLPRETLISAFRRLPCASTAGSRREIKNAARSLPFVGGASNGFLTSNRSSDSPVPAQRIVESPGTRERFFEDRRFQRKPCLLTRAVFRPKARTATRIWPWTPIISDGGISSIIIRAARVSTPPGSARPPTDCASTATIIPGDYLGSGIDGLEAYVHCNAQDQLCQISKRGKVVVYGDVGQTFFYGAKGGDIFVLGNAAGRPMINAVGKPKVVINGTALDFLAESFMAGDPLAGGGFAIVNGLRVEDDGDIVPLDLPYPGSNLLSLASGGAIYVRDPQRTLVAEQLNGGMFGKLYGRRLETDSAVSAGKRAAVRYQDRARPSHRERSFEKPRRSLPEGHAAKRGKEGRNRRGRNGRMT